VSVDLPGLVLDLALEVIEATIPILVLIAVFQFVVLRRPIPHLGQVAIGVAMAMLGFLLFMVGAKISLIPMGMAIGAALAGAPVAAMVAVALIMGAAVALAEPAVRILAFEIDEVSSGSLRKRWIAVAVAFGVGVAVALAVVADRARASVAGDPGSRLPGRAALDGRGATRHGAGRVRCRRGRDRTGRGQLRAADDDRSGARPGGRRSRYARIRRGGDHRARPDRYDAGVEPDVAQEGTR